MKERKKKGNKNFRKFAQKICVGKFFINKFPLYIQNEISFPYINIVEGVIYTINYVYIPPQEKNKLFFPLHTRLCQHVQFIIFCCFFSSFVLLLFSIFLFSITCYTHFAPPASSFVPLQFCCFVFFLSKTKKKIFVGKTFHVYTSKLKTKVLEVIFSLPIKPTPLPSGHMCGKYLRKIKETSTTL